MKLQQGMYLVGDSFRTLARHKGVLLLSVIIMSLSLLVLAVFLLATDNMMALLARTSEDLKVYVYLKDDVSQDVIEKNQLWLASLPEVDTIEFVSKHQAMLEFQQELGEEFDVLESLQTNPLPASFRVELKAKDKKSTEEFAARIGSLEVVEEVNYGKDFVERFSVITRVFLYIDVVLGVIVILSSVFIISNTVRLTILTRRKSIEILKLVGATNRFITTPFVIEGAVQGGLASLVSLGLLAVIHVGIKKILPDLMFLPGDKIMLYVLTCTAIGAAGSYASLRRSLQL